MADTAEFACRNCGGKVTAKIPDPLFFNKMELTIVAFPHETLARCPNCRQAFCFTVTGIALTQSGFLAVNVPEPNNITLAPPGFDPNKLM